MKTVLVWEEAPGAFTKFPSAVRAKVASAFDRRNDVLCFCVEHFGRAAPNGVDARWAMMTNPGDYDIDTGRYKSAFLVVGFKTEADLMLFLTGMDRC